MSRYSKSDYINREMAADSIVIECDGVTLEQARQALKDCPSADVVKVVRCKECKWWTKQEDCDKCDIQKNPERYEITDEEEEQKIINARKGEE